MRRRLVKSLEISSSWIFDKPAVMECRIFLILSLTLQCVSKMIFNRKSIDKCWRCRLFLFIVLLCFISFNSAWLYWYFHLRTHKKLTSEKRVHEASDTIVASFHVTFGSRDNYASSSWHKFSFTSLLLSIWKEKR